MTKALEQKEFKKILLPIDFTGASEHALEYAVSMATHYGAKLYLMHVVNTEREITGFYLPHLSFDTMYEDMKKSAENMVNEYCDNHLAGFDNYETIVLEGSPSAEILKCIDDNGIDVVVMGTFGSGRVEKFLFGSTTDLVVKSAGCPVLVVPPRVSFPAGSEQERPE